MRLVIDANILFAAIIRVRMTRALIFDQRLELYSPLKALEEIKKYAAVIQIKAHISEQEFQRLIEHSFDAITIIDHPLPDIESPDPDDKAYLALARHLECPLWSNDTRLKEQQVADVLTTEELIRLLEREKRKKELRKNSTRAAAAARLRGLRSRLRRLLDRLLDRLLRWHHHHLNTRRTRTCF